MISAHAPRPAWSYCATVAVAGFVLFIGTASGGTFGTTIITHGFQLGGAPMPWMHSMAYAIEKRAAGGTPMKGTILVYQPSTGNWSWLAGTYNSGAEIILLFDWTTESDALNQGGTMGFAEAAADALYAALRDPQLPGALEGHDLLANGVHFIGHSRGTVVNSECVERLAKAGIQVEQLTTLDPHPVNGSLPPTGFNWGDPNPQTWSTIGWADNYWRADGSPTDFNGMLITGAYNVNLGPVIESTPTQMADPLFEHVVVRAWYHGTIDLNAAFDYLNGTPIHRATWYSNDGEDEGYYYSEIGGGSGSRPADGGRVTPVYSPLSIYNGNFEIVDLVLTGVGHAGWRYHGGNMSGSTAWASASPPSGSTYYLSLNSASPSRTHNRLYVDSSVRGIKFDFRVTGASENDQLKVILLEPTGATGYEMAIDVTNTGSWRTGRYAIPKARRGHAYRLRFTIVDAAPTGLQVDLDNISWSKCNGVLIAPSDSDDLAWRNEVRERTGERCDYFDASAGTPTAGSLIEYCAVFTWTNASYNNSALFGDLLADFVDQGGVAILGQGTYPSTQANFLEGRIMDPDYCPVTVTEFIPAAYIPGSGNDCAFCNVEELSAQDVDQCYALANAVQDGEFDTGALALAWRPDRRVYYSPGNTGGEYTTGDTAQLIANIYGCVNEIASGACCDPVTGMCIDDAGCGDCAAPSVLYHHETCAYLALPCGDMGVYFDGDGDVDLADYAMLQRCLTGSGGGPLDPGCEVCDINGDERVDEDDFEQLGDSLTGPQ